MSGKSLEKFKKIIWDYYRDNRRDFPWRNTHDPYKILVSEIMLQQTQASRVISKYESFLKKFPNTNVLANAPLGDVLLEWQGLGYNRRALYLKKCAEQIEKDFGGVFPKDFKSLCLLPGIGPATAGDVMAFAWNIPHVVIETNIRSVFIHFFFQDTKKVSDKEIVPLIEKTLDMHNVREWYWALFDYGAYLKQTSNPSRKSTHHNKQTTFKGSYRQKRAHVLKIILNKKQTQKEIETISTYDSHTVSKILHDLENEGFIKRIGKQSPQFQIVS
ncbi:MAG: A/G-specific adenine glycosylase [bacterium]